MQLSPCYGDEPVITLDGAPAAIAEPAIRQRRRLVQVLASLTDEQWNHPSRCAGWSGRDVTIHLDSTNAFWAFSIAQGLKGAPTQFLATFDPVASPVELVAAAGDLAPADVLDSFRASTETLCDLLAGLDHDGWRTLAEAPPGHLSVSALAHHALWDSWVHERDILLPLGLTPDEEDDEILGSLRYVAALGPALGLNNGAPDQGVLGVSTTDPASTFLVEVGDAVAVCTTADTDGADLVLTGEAVDLLEALSTRAPLGQPVPEESAWLLGGLAETFEVERD